LIEHIATSNACIESITNPDSMQRCLHATCGSFKIFSKSIESRVGSPFPTRVPARWHGLRSGATAPAAAAGPLEEGRPPPAAAPAPCSDAAARPCSDCRPPWRSRALRRTPPTRAAGAPQAAPQGQTPVPSKTCEATSSSPNPIPAASQAYARVMKADCRSMDWHSTSA